MNTFQSNIRESNSNDLTSYALFLGGLNVTHDALMQYDPLRTGYGRIFMIRKPRFLTQLPDFSPKLDRFKHILEYANTGVSGNGNITMDFGNMQGGYTGRQIDIPNVAKDDTNELTIKTYEFTGSPVREVIQMWINGVSDIQSGFAHYYGVDLDYQQANHTAEFIYVVTDPSGKNIEYAALFANCMPKDVRFDHFNYEAGQHDVVPVEIEFTATRYMSPQINAKAKMLIYKYNVLMNSLNFNGGYLSGDINDLPGSKYDTESGKLVAKDKSDYTLYGIGPKVNAMAETKQSGDTDPEYKFE
jgi:hypothetical protein